MVDTIEYLGMTYTGEVKTASPMEKVHMWPLLVAENRIAEITLANGTRVGLTATVCGYILIKLNMLVSSKMANLNMVKNTGREQ